MSVRMRNVILSSFVALGATASAVASGADRPVPTVLVDSERGDDAGDGSAERPFRTPERARQEVRRLKARPGFRGAEVAMRGTFAYPSGTFELTEADSGTAAAPIVWRSDVRPASFSGAYTFAASEFAPVTDAAVRARLRPEVRDRVRVLDLRARGIEVPAPKDVFRVWDTCELYCGGRAGTLAREPNRGWLEIRADQEVDRGVTPADLSKGREDEWGVRGGTFAYDAGLDAPAKWPVAEGVWLYGYLCMDWYAENVRVGSVDRAKRQVTLAGVPFYGVGVRDAWKPYVPPRRYYAFNFLEAVDEPGEWFVDAKAGRLYLYPVDGGEVRLAVCRDPVIRLDGVRDVRVKGVSVAYSAATNAVEVTGSTRVTLEDMDVSWVMANGVSFRGGRDVTLRRSRVQQVGRSWAVVSGGDRRTLEPSGHRLTGNSFDRCGRHAGTTVGLSVEGVGARVDGNRIQDTPYIAVRYDGNEIRIDGNEIWCAMMQGGDGGAIYTGRDWGSQGNVVSNNYIHHLGPSGVAWRKARGLPVDSEANIRPDALPSTMGVYLDDCDAGDVIVDNVLEETGFGIFVGGGRHNVVRGNTMINCKMALHLDTRGLERARPGKGIPNDSWDLLAKIDRVGFRDAPWKDRYPWLLDYMDDEPLLPLHTEFSDNVAVCCGQFFELTGQGMPETAKRLVIRGNRAIGMPDDACRHMNNE